MLIPLTPKFKIRPNAGFAALFALAVVLTVTLIVISSLSVLTISEQKIAANAVKSAQAFYTAEAGIEDTLYRVIKGKNYQNSNSLLIGSSEATISVAETNNQKTIRVDGEQNNRWRNLQVKLEISTQDVSFHYGVQVGDGGLTMSNNSRVTGSIYSNGPAQGGNGAVITGDAWIANTAADINQESVVATSNFIFGQTSPQIDAAQSFTPSASDRLTKISLCLKKTGSPGNKTVRVLTDNGNKPSKNLVASGAYGTLDASQVSPNNYGWIDIAINMPPNLIAGTKYWLVVDTSASSGNYFWWGKDATDAYAGGTGQYSDNWNASNPTWSSANGDLAFRVYLGGTTNSLDSFSIGGHAHANTINNCSITGDAYYQTISNSSVGGASYPNSPDPGMENMPISQSNIDDWKTQAETGGIFNGNYVMSGGNNSLGPKKIIGDLTLTNGADVTITGTIYVTGNINLSNNAKLRLSASYGQLSGVVIADGLISVSNNCVFYTNGAGTYLLLLSTKTGSAINISNNANTVIFYAANGTVDISNNAALKEVTAYQISLSNNAEVTYESGLASAKFSSGSGATWEISDWQEVP